MAPGGKPAGERSRRYLRFPRRGDFVALLDSDDLYAPHAIADTLEVFAARPDADVVVGDAEAFLYGRLVNPSVLEGRQIHFPATGMRDFDGGMVRLSTGPLCSTSSMVFRKQTLRSLGQPVFDTGFRYNEDWDLEFRLFASYNVIFRNGLASINRRFDDETRPYSLSAARATREERLELAAGDLAILRRYCDWPVWAPALQKKLADRADELAGLLFEGGCTAPRA